MQLLKLTSELGYKGNIQKLDHVNFVATDTKPSDLLIAKMNFTLGPIEKSICFV